MARTVLLRHDLPDGTHHFDWLFKPAPAAPGADADERILIAWRLPRRPEEAVGVDMQVERLAPHRRLYLEYEGPISGGRGEVRRVASGAAEIYQNHAREFDAAATLDGVSLRLRAQPVSREAWLLHVTRL